MTPIDNNYTATDIRLMTYEEVAIMCHVSARTVSRWTADKHDSLPCIKINGVLRFLPEDVEAFLRGHRLERRVKSLDGVPLDFLSPLHRHQATFETPGGEPQ